MSKIKSEQELRELFETQFNHYDCGNLDYKPVAKLIGQNGNIFNL